MSTWAIANFLLGTWIGQGSDVGMLVLFSPRHTTDSFLHTFNEATQNGHKKASMPNLVDLLKNRISVL
jgi:hypothetical protein